MLRTFPRRIILAALAVISLAGPSLPAETGPVIRSFPASSGSIRTARPTLPWAANSCSVSSTAPAATRARIPRPWPASRLPSSMMSGHGSASGYLRKFLGDPQAVKPGTTMPNLFAGDNDKASKIEALVHFLALHRHDPAGTARPQGDRPGPRPVITRSAASPATARATRPAGRTRCCRPRCRSATSRRNTRSRAWPRSSRTRTQARPGGRMPHVCSAPPRTPSDVASYLLQGIKRRRARGKGARTYAYYEGSWDRLPDFAKLKPVAAGTGAAFDLGVARRGRQLCRALRGLFQGRARRHVHLLPQQRRRQQSRHRRQAGRRATMACMRRNWQVGQGQADQGQYTRSVVGFFQARRRRRAGRHDRAARPGPEQPRRA